MFSGAEETYQGPGKEEMMPLSYTAYLTPVSNTLSLLFHKIVCYNK